MLAPQKSVLERQQQLLIAGRAAATELAKQNVRRALTRREFASFEMKGNLAAITSLDPLTGARGETTFHTLPALLNRRNSLIKEGLGIGVTQQAIEALRNAHSQPVGPVPAAPGVRQPVVHKALAVVAG